jgi:DNA integrity scanning protein DisA with diadenylate cyclase activity
LRAAADALHRLLQRRRQLQSTLALALQQMEGHTLGALVAHAWQAAQRFDQITQQLAHARACSQGKLGRERPTPARRHIRATIKTAS